MGRFIPGGSSGGGAAEIVALDIFTSSGTWTKPAAALPTDLVVVDMWDAGGSGAIGSISVSAMGGAGGNFNRIEFFAGRLSATEAVVVGAGGAAVVSTASTNGAAGGLSSFAGIGSRLAPGVATTGATPGTAPTAGSCLTKDMENRGGLCSLTNDSGASLPNVFAGGQGGCAGTSVKAGGSSLAGGAGGSSASGTSPIAVAGSAPGGGGGAARVTSGTGTSGAGARGEVRVYVIRGVFTVGDAVLPTSI